MSFGRTNQTLNSNGHDFDLNIPYLEDLNFNAVNEFSSSILVYTQQASQNSIKHMNIEAANKDNEVQQSSTVDTTILATNSSVGVSHVEPKYVASISFASASIPQRHRRHRRGRKFRLSDPNRFCTNFYCKTKRTPLWRKGPLGPKTLCNACGLQYIKTVSRRGSGSDFHSAVSVHGEGDASPGSVSAETVRGSSNF
ncbi:hypothetical protein VNO77_22391 [Canavalia gladiata]|uniref:GATA-type domain-containing protein n=1 Tax=Canavalia gladiata TaxID=3824 RepID=A0AAN9L5R8_CANGL